MRIALEITILEIEGGRVRIGFEADNKLPIHRREVWDRICNGQGNGNGNGHENGDGAGTGKADGQPLAAALARMEGRRQAGG
jgi:hypothetical protein